DARWLRALRLDDGAPLVALAFVVRHDAPNYAGRLREDELIDILTRACGQYGTSLDYLLRTVEALRASGVPDPHLERLAHRAQRALAAPNAVRRVRAHTP
ncbi:MAG TPA: gamma-glutamylcyclotransferase, partial [Burkholderiaceae bacterium]|nr:gamma-glutamylcyclotransferase [Burkholderiaceae bacterium]